MVAKISRELTAALLVTFSTSALADAPAEVTGQAAIERLVGNTVVSALVEPLPDMQDGLLYLRPDGSAAWVNIGLGDEPGEVRWAMDEREWLCLSDFPDPEIEDSCLLVTITGESVSLSDDGSSSDGILALRLEQGNPHGL